MVENELGKWSTTWGASDAPAEELPPWPLMAKLVPSLEQEIRRIGCTFSWVTGLGLDRMHPRHLTMVSDNCLFVLI